MIEFDLSLGGVTDRIYFFVLLTARPRLRVDGQELGRFRWSEHLVLGIDPAVSMISITNPVGSVKRSVQGLAEIRPAGISGAHLVYHPPRVWAPSPGRIEARPRREPSSRSTRVNVVVTPSSKIMATVIRRGPWWHQAWHWVMDRSADTYEVRLVGIGVGRGGISYTYVGSSDTAEQLAALYLKGDSVSSG